MPPPTWETSLSWLSEYNHTPTTAEAAALQKYFTEHPEQLKVAGEDGWLPLHSAAAWQRGEHAVSIVAFLIQAHRSGVRRVRPKYTYGWLPLHLAALNQKGKAGAAVVTLLLTAYPDAAMQKRLDGKLPVDYAEQQAQLPLSCIAMLRAAAEGDWAPVVTLPQASPPPAVSRKESRVLAHCTCSSIPSLFHLCFLRFVFFASDINSDLSGTLSCLSYPSDTFRLSSLLDWHGRICDASLCRLSFS